MTDSNKKLDIRVKAVDDASSVFTRVKENYEGFLRKLRQEGGRRGILGETAELFEGKGALVGISQVGREVEEATEKFVKLNEEIHAGGKSTGEIAEGLAEGLPIIGSWVKSGRQIRGIIDGSTEAVEELNQENESTDLLLKAQLRTIHAVQEAYSDYVDFARKARSEISQALMPDEGDRAAEATRRRIEEEVERIRKEGEAKIAKLGEANKEAVEHARKTAGMRITAPEGSAQWEEQVTRKQHAAARLAAASRQQADAEAQIRADTEAKAALATQSIQLAAERERQKQADEASRRTKEAVEKSAKEVNDARAEANEEALRINGKGQEADLAKLKRTLEERLEAIKKESEEESKHFKTDDTSNQAAVVRRYQDKVAAAQAKAAEDEGKIRQAAADHAAEVDQKLRQGKIQAVEAEVRAGDKSKALELEQLKITDQYIERRRELADLAKAEYLTDQQRASIQQQIGGLALQEAAAKNAAIAEHNKSTQETLDDAKAQALQEQAQLGNHAAEIELKRLNIVKRLKEELIKLKDIIADTNSTADQKAAAQKAIGDLEASAAQASARAGVAGFHLTGSFDAGTSSPLVTGAAAAARERAAIYSHQRTAALPDATSAEEKKNGQKLAEIEKHLAALVAAAAAKVTAGIGLRW